MSADCTRHARHRRLALTELRLLLLLRRHRGSALWHHRAVLVLFHESPVGLYQSLLLINIAFLLTTTTGRTYLVTIKHRAWVMSLQPDLLRCMHDEFRVDRSPYKLFIHMRKGRLRLQCLLVHLSIMVKVGLLLVLLLLLLLLCRLLMQILGMLRMAGLRMEVRMRGINGLPGMLWMLQSRMTVYIRSSRCVGLGGRKLCMRLRLRLRWSVHMCLLCLIRWVVLRSLLRCQLMLWRRAGGRHAVRVLALL